jgi:PERQ amino acid-rich with GYF domain-containing protein
VGTGGSRLAHLIPKDSTENPAPKPSDAPSWRPRPRTDTDPFSTDDGPSVPAVSGARQDNNSPATSVSDHTRRNILDTPIKSTSGDFGISGLNIGGSADTNGSGTPETNPYRSPPGNHENDDTDRHGQPPVGSDHQSVFGTFPRPFGARA